MELERKFGFWTGVTLVVGIVIGSGIFFKAGEMLQTTGGSVPMALLAFLVGALAMIFGALTFVEISKDIPGNNGLNDYAKDSFGKTGEFVSQLIGWFMAVLYFPIFMAVLPLIAADFTFQLLGVEEYTYFNAVFVGLIYLFGVFIMNMLAPLIASKFQISTTFIKLIPLVAVAIVGITLGIINGGTFDALHYATDNDTGGGNFFKATIVAAFTFEGWILATNISSELKDPEKNITKILVVGPAIILVIYITYFLGLVSSNSVSAFLTDGQGATTTAFTNLFGDVAGSVLTAFIIVSVLGALNGIVLSGSKAFYLMGRERKGLLPSKTSYVSKKSNFPIVGALFSLAIAIPMFFVWGFYLIGDLKYSFDSTAILVLQILYIAIFISFMIKKKDRNVVKRFIIPSLAIIGALIIAYGGAIKEGFEYDIIICATTFLLYIPIYIRSKKHQSTITKKTESF